MIKRAIELACWAHKDQKRISKIPYISHVAKVAYEASLIDDTIKDGFHKEEIISASWLHDTLEDTEITEADILDITNTNVLKLVKELTNDSNTPGTGKRTEYMIQKFNNMIPAALFIKLCDRLDNASGWMNVNYKFAFKYIKETEDIIENIQIYDKSDFKSLIKDKIVDIENIIKEFYLSQEGKPKSKNE